MYYLTPYYSTVLSGDVVFWFKKNVYDDVIKWKHFLRDWSFVRGIHRSPVNPPHKGQWRGALMFSLICLWINGWVNNREADDLRRYRAHYDVTVMCVSYRMQCYYKSDYRQVVNKLMPVQNWRHSADDIFKRISSKKSVETQISLQCATKCLINSISSLAPNRRQAITWTNDDAVY